MSLDTVTVDLYDPTGVTHLATLANARKVTWQDELSKVGNGSFEVPLADAALIADRCIVKFSLWGAVRYAVRIVSEACVLSVDGNRTWLRFENQPGLLSLLGDAVVLPEYGLKRRSRSQRNFGFMSLDGAWRVSSEWVTPLGNSWSADVPRHGYPPALKPTNPSWIAASPGPSSAVAPGTVNYYRRTFTVSVPTYISIMATGDNFLTLYLDGDEVISPNPDHPYGWRDASSLSVVLAAGTHVLAAKVENADNTDGSNSPLAFICTVQTLNTSGVATGTLLKSDTANWTVHASTPEPGWARGQVLYQVIAEARARGVWGPSHLTIGFSATADSNSAAWTDRGQQVLSVASLNLAEVATQLAESNLDVWVNPATMTLRAYKRKGSDKSATVQLKLGKDDGTLKQYETTKAMARRTRVISQLADGSWTTTTDDLGLAAVGLTEAGLSVGTASSEQTAYTAALALLKESAAPLISTTGEPTTLAGAQPYVDYDLGDTITVPGHRGVGTLKARVLAITVDASGDTVRAWPELTEDRSGTVDVDVPRRLPPTAEERLRMAIDRMSSGAANIRASLPVHMPIPTLADGTSWLGSIPDLSNLGDGNVLGWDANAGLWGPVGGSGSIVVVAHGTDGTVARPTGAAVVYWIGTATPANGLNYDFWFNGPP